MNDRPVEAIEIATSVFDQHHVRYKRLQPEQLSLSPSPRLQERFLVLGFGSPALTIYISQVGENKLLFVAYRKLLIKGVNDHDLLHTRVLGSNAEEAVCLWKVEIRWECCYPVAEMMLEVNEDMEAARQQIWEACSAVDSFFRGKECAFV